MTGIVEILFDTLLTFAGCSARQKHTHQFFVTLQPVDLLLKSIDKSLLIILWSTVQVRDALPFNSSSHFVQRCKVTFFMGVFQVDARCQHSSSTLRGCAV